MLEGRAGKEGQAEGGGVIGNRLGIKAGHSYRWMEVSILQIKGIN